MHFDHAYEIGAWNVCARCGLGRDDHPDMLALKPAERPDTGTYEKANRAGIMAESVRMSRNARSGGGRPPTEKP